MSTPVRAFLTEPDYIGLLLLWSMLVAVMYFYNISRYVQFRRQFRILFLTAVLTCATVVLYELLNWYQAGIPELFLVQYLPGAAGLMQTLYEARSRVLAASPWILLLLMLTATVEQIQIGMWKRIHISSASVKEAFDLLPLGCCYSLPNGLPKLVNHTMDRISRSLTGSPVEDAEGFWTSLQTGQLAGTIDSGDYPILQLEDGSVYSFWRDEIRTADGRYYELIAVDVTEEYRLTKELEQKQQEARVQNVRLKALIGTIEYVTMSRELLQIKTALHDNLGQSLLYARRYLLQPDSVDRNEMLKVWNDNLRHLQHEGPENWQLPYYVIGKQAEQLGVELTVYGKLPVEEHLLNVTDVAISTHVINVLRHTGGKHVWIRISEDKKEYTLRFTNDGRRPEGEIREQGGLANLRREVEALGGVMTVRSSPYFELILVLPKEKRTESSYPEQL